MSETNLATVKRAFEEADLNWGGAWTIRNVELPDWVRDLLDEETSNQSYTPPGVAEGPFSYRTGHEATRAKDDNAEEASALEGLLREQTSYTRTRDRRLRDQAIHLSKGICAVCETDFSRILAGKGIRALQVHHRNQLALNDIPVITKLSDLAVVCANCHALIHMNMTQALSVEELKEQLKKA